MGLSVGVDVGTTGARAAACDADGRLVAIAGAPLPPPALAGGRTEQDPELWWAATERALRALLARIEPGAVGAVAVDGTSGTVLAVDGAGRPLAPGRMYNDNAAVAASARIAAVAPQDSAAHGPTSGLAKALELAAETRPRRILHQADWIAGRLTGRYGTSDENNALKTGYDPVARRWPDWIAALGLDPALLPEVLEPGTPVAPLAPAVAAALGLRPDAVVAAGTTDGCASFLATGASEPGDAVSALGSTLTLKVLSPRPVFGPAFGVYSHRIGHLWIPGGASNTGGAVIAAHFSPERLAELEPRLEPERPTGRDYYPLLRPGERFPLADPGLPPRLHPRPADDAEFLQAILEGIAGIEMEGYARLASLGAPYPRRVLTVGGGAKNEAWTLIRRRLLGVPVSRAETDEAAFGTARLARRGACFT